jgi:arylsulfatase
MKDMGIVPGDTELSPRSPWWNYGETDSGVNPPWSSLPGDRRRDLARRMAIFAAMIDRMDQQVGRVFADLRANGEWENTLIVFLSDNGACAEWDPRGFDTQTSNNNILHTGDEFEKMGGPGTYHSVGSGWANASNTPWRLYKHFSHEGGINSLCIVHWPAGLGDRAHTIDESPAHIIDLLPTAIAAAHAASSGSMPLPGTNLIAQLRNEPHDERTLFFEHEGHRAVRAGRWKLVALRDQPWELYDFSISRTEQNDVAAQHRDIVAELDNRWNAWAEANHVTPLPKDYKVGYLRKTE